MKDLIILVSLIVLAQLLAASEVRTTIRCADVNEALTQCVKFLTSDGQAEVRQECCIRLSALATEVRSVDDRRKTCNCIQRTYKTIKPNRTLAQNLPQICKISLPFSTATGTDCIKII